MKGTNLLEKIKKADLKKLMTSKAVLIFACAVLLGLALLVNALIPKSDKLSVNSGDTDEAGKILGNPVLVDQNVSEAEADAEASGKAYFAQAALTRAQTRDEAIGVLQTIVDSEEALADTKEQALKDIASLVSEMTEESDVETLIKAKGFEECIAIISGDRATVIVKTEGLLETDLAQINEIIYSETGILPSNTIIQEK